MWRDKKAIIFDLDGTLVDSMWMWKQIDIEYLALYGYELPETLQVEIEGMSFTEVAIYFKEKFLIEDSIEAIQDKWLEMARDKYMYETPLKDGIDLFIKEAYERGILMGIASSNSRELVETILDVHNIRRYFTSIHTCCEVEKGKPAPDIYLLVADELQVTPNECLVFEDIPAGLMAGKSAGMKTCAVWDQYSIPYEDEKRDVADYYIHTYHDLLNDSYEVLS